jgi:hypothetical protein
MGTKINSFDLIDLKDKGIFQFVTLTDKNIYVVYRQNKTNINDIINLFSQNYECKNFEIDYKSNTLNRNFTEEELLKTPWELELPKKEIIKLKGKYVPNITYFSHCKKLTEESDSISESKQSEKNSQLTKLEENSSEDKSTKSDSNSDQLTDLIDFCGDKIVKPQDTNSSEKINVNIRMLSGKQFSIETDIGSSVSDLKKLIFNESQIKEATQRLIFKQSILQDDRKLSSYSIIENSTIHMILTTRAPQQIVVNSNVKKPEGVCWNVYVSTLTGKKFIFAVADATTVYNLKELVLDKEGIPIDQQRMIFAGKQLEDNYKLIDYNICQDSTVHLVLRLKGGMYHETSGKNGNFEPLENCIIIMDD